MNEVPLRRFFDRRAQEVAPELLGLHLTHDTPEGAVTLRITEVEAYQGEQDPGSHAFRGQSKRNGVMFGEPGHLYVYRHMGLHTCVNVVCGPVGRAAAVLLRAGEVVAGQDLARERRRRVGVVEQDRDLARGPARLTVALDITMAFLGTDLLAPEGALTLTRLPGVERASISAGPRVGVSGPGGDGSAYPWRFWLTDDETVSAYRAASPRRRPTGQNVRVESQSRRSSDQRS